jgi:hypothetical protein
VADWIKRIFGKRQQPVVGERLVPIATIKLPVIEEAEKVQLYQDQIMRKQWYEGIIEDQGIPINPYLGCIVGGNDAVIRSTSEVVGRLVALTAVAVKGEGLEQEHVAKFVEAKNVRPFLSPKEIAFIDDIQPDEMTRVQFSWQYECAWVMLWALRYFDGPLAFPNEICDVPRLVETVRDATDLGANGVQSTNNVLNEADLIYRYHWAVRQSAIDGKPAPGGLIPGVVQERHRALNWLINDDDSAAWDDVATHT